MVKPSINRGTLRAIDVPHPQAIAFDNLDPLFGRPVPLDARSLEQKLIRDRRGRLLLRHPEESIRFYQDVLGFKHEGKLEPFEIIPKYALMRVTTYESDTNYLSLTTNNGHL